MSLWPITTCGRWSLAATTCTETGDLKLGYLLLSEDPRTKIGGSYWQAKPSMTRREGKSSGAE